MPVVIDQSEATGAKRLLKSSFGSENVKSAGAEKPRSAVPLKRDWVHWER
jgi:hypothetical protein